MNTFFEHLHAKKINLYLNSIKQDLIELSEYVNPEDVLEHCSKVVFSEDFDPYEKPKSRFLPQFSDTRDKFKSDLKLSKAQKLVNSRHDLVVQNLDMYLKYINYFRSIDVVGSRAAVLQGIAKALEDSKKAIENYKEKYISQNQDNEIENDQGSWLYAKENENKTHGPYTTKEIKDFLARRTINPEDYIIGVGLSDDLYKKWKKIKLVPVFSPNYRSLKAKSQGNDLSSANDTNAKGGNVTPEADPSNIQSATVNSPIESNLDHKIVYEKLKNSSNLENTANQLGTENISKLSDNNVANLLYSATDKDEMAKILGTENISKLSDYYVFLLLRNATDKDEMAKILGTKNISKLSDNDFRNLLINATDDKDEMAKMIINHKKELSEEDVANLLQFATDRDEIAKLIINHKKELSDENVYHLIRHATDKDEMAKIIINYKKELSDKNVHYLLAYATKKDEIAKLIINRKKELSNYDVENLLYYATDKDEIAKMIINHKKELSDKNVQNLQQFAPEILKKYHRSSLIVRNEDEAVALVKELFKPDMDLNEVKSQILSFLHNLKIVKSNKVYMSANGIAYRALIEGMPQKIRDKINNNEVYNFSDDEFDESIARLGLDEDRIKKLIPAIANKDFTDFKYLS